MVARAISTARRPDTNARNAWPRPVIIASGSAGLAPLSSAPLKNAASAPPLAASPFGAAALLFGAAAMGARAAAAGAAGLATGIGAATGTVSANASPGSSNGEVGERVSA